MITAHTVGKRIQRLRLANGLNQREFAQATGIATGTISMIENGRQSADNAMYAAMANALGCHVDYFIRPVEDLISTRPWLRAYADASKRAVDRYVADTHAAVEAIESLGLRTLPDVIPTFDGDPNDDDAVEDFAALVRAAAKLDEGDVVGNSMRAAERLGCIVLPMDDELGRHLGMSLRVDGLPVIRVSRPRIEESDPSGREVVVPPGDRQRFTVAHELAHLAIHATRPPPMTADEASRIEKQANRFAGAFLTPAEPLLEDLRRLGDRVTLTTLQDLKARWGVAIKMLVVRMRQLERIDDYHARSLYKQISARRWNKVEPVPVGHENAIWLDRALHKAYTTATVGGGHSLEVAAGVADLSRPYFDRWIDWSVRVSDAGADASVIELESRPRSVRNSPRQNQTASIHRLPHR